MVSEENKKSDNLLIWNKIHDTSEINISSFEHVFPTQSMMAFYQHYVLKRGQNSATKNWLEFGCGSSVCLKNLVNFGLKCNLTIADISPVSLEKTLKFWDDNEVKISRSLIVDRKLDVVSDSQDFINAEGSIYYDNYEGLKITVGELFRILKPGGFIRCTILSNEDRYCKKATYLKPKTYKVEKVGHWENGLTVCCLSKSDAVELFHEFEAVTVGFEAFNYTGFDGTKSFLIVTASK